MQQIFSKQSMRIEPHRERSSLRGPRPPRIGVDAIP
jgi:hypothetical protein